jgi:hypothetical protein
MQRGEPVQSSKEAVQLARLEMLAMLAHPFPMPVVAVSPLRSGPGRHQPVPLAVIEDKLQLKKLMQTLKEPLEPDGLVKIAGCILRQPQTVVVIRFDMSRLLWFEAVIGLKDRRQFEWVEPAVLDTDAASFSHPWPDQNIDGPAQRRRLVGNVHLQRDS